MKIKKSRIVLWVAVVALLAALFFTRPTKSAHTDAVFAETKAALADAAQAFPEFGLDKLVKDSDWLDRSIKAGLYFALSYSDYGLLTVCRIDLPGESKVVSVGVMGHVFTFNRDDLLKAIN